jgi:hypothetical protein
VGICIRTATIDGGLLGVFWLERQIITRGTHGVVGLRATAFYIGWAMGCYYGKETECNNRGQRVQETE